MRRVPSKVKHTVIKTWANSWCTTTRLAKIESEIWPCIFGCDARDSLAHYLICPRLWSSISSIVKVELVYLDPVLKLSWAEPTAWKLKIIAVASRVYHAMKFDFHELVSTAVESGRFEQVNVLLVELAEHYCHDLKCEVT